MSPGGMLLAFGAGVQCFGQKLLLATPSPGVCVFRLEKSRGRGTKGSPVCWRWGPTFPRADAGFPDVRSKPGPQGLAMQ